MSAEFLAIGGKLPLDHTSVFLLDIVALVFFIATWMGYSKFAEQQYDKVPNLMYIMDQMRLRWMQKILTRHNRIADASLIGNLLRSISFFANTSIFILIGLITVLGYSESAIDMINAIPFAVTASIFAWEMKIFTLIIIFIYAFFKFTWSLRQYNYCCILAGAAPMPDETPEEHEAYANRAGRVIMNAGKHFNMGMRAYYFGLAAISWFLHPVLFMAVTALVIAITYRREFRSHTMIDLAKLSNDKR